MRILVVGATGTIGAAVAGELDAHGHIVLGASRTSPRFAVDVRDSASVCALYADVRSVDAVVCAVPFCGDAASPASESDIGRRFQPNVIGQINLVLHGLKHVKRCFVLTSGATRDARLPERPGDTLLRKAIEGFVRTAAAGSNCPRINIVAPPLLHETARECGVAGGGIPAGRVAEVYRAAIEGRANGEVLTVG